MTTTKVYDAEYISRILKAEIEDYNQEDSFEDYGIEFLTALRLTYKLIQPAYGDIDFSYVAEEVAVEMEAMIFTQEAIDGGISQVEMLWNELS